MSTPIAVGAGATSPIGQPSNAADGAPTASPPPPPSKKSLPPQPFSFQLRYGDGLLPVDASAPSASMPPAATRPTAANAADPASPYCLYDCGTSTPDLPCIPAAASLMQLHVRLLLHPSYKRGDVGSVASSLRALQVACHYLFGWSVWQRRGESGTRTLAGVAYPELHIRLWSNPSLPTNLQLVGAQRAVLSRLPAIVADAFGRRDMEDLIRSAVQSVYLSRGMPTHHHIDAAAAAKGASGAGAQRFAATMGTQFPETIAQLLGVLQQFLSSRSAEDEERDDSLFGADTASNLAAATSPAAATPAPAAARSSLVDSLMSMAPSSDPVKDWEKAAPPAEPLRFQLRNPLFPQLPRALQSTLSLLKKSVAYVAAVEVQLQDEGRMGVHERQRYVQLQMRGCEYHALYAFLQHALPTPTPTPAQGAAESSSSAASAASAAAASAATPTSPADSTGDASSAATNSAASSMFRWLSGLSLFAEWLGLLHSLPLPEPAHAAEDDARRLVQRVTLASAASPAPR